MSFMAALIKTYPSEEGARRAVETLWRAGVPRRHIRLLTSRPLRDTRREPRGGFGGPVGPDAPVGSFGGRALRRREATSSFATGSFTGDPDRRKGSFADVERVEIVSHDDAGERARVTGYRGIRLLLRRAALDERAVDRTVRELHAGHSVVLVDVAKVASSDARAELQRMAEAA
jgi:hypothetical protein